MKEDWDLDRLTTHIRDMEAILSARPVGEDLAHFHTSLGWTHNQRAELFCATGRWEEAIFDYRAAIQYGLDDYLRWSTLGDCLLEAKHYHEAAKAYNKASACEDLRNEDASYLACRKATAECLGEIEKARRGGQSEDSALLFMRRHLFHLDAERVKSATYRIRAAEPSDLLAQLACACFGGGVDDSLLASIAADSTRVRRLIGATQVGQHEPHRAALLDATVALETGDPAAAMQLVREVMLSYAGKPDVYKYPLVWNEGYSLGTLVEAYLSAYRGDLVHAHERFEEAAGGREDHPFYVVGMQDLMRLAPQVLERLIADGQWEAAAEIAGLGGDAAGAAECHQKAAAAQEDAGDVAAAAANFAKAADNYAATGATALRDAARLASQRLRNQPVLQCESRFPEHLFVGEWDVLTVRVTNFGFGPAKTIRLSLTGPMTTSGETTIGQLAVGESQTVEIEFRPDNAGRAVPVSLNITYRDALGQQTLPPVPARLAVARPG